MPMVVADRTPSIRLILMCTISFKLSIVSTSTSATTSYVAYNIYASLTPLALRSLCNTSLSLLGSVLINTKALTNFSPLSLVYEVLFFQFTQKLVNSNVNVFLFSDSCANNLS